MIPEDVIRFCFRPRTIYDIAAEFNTTPKAAHPKLRKLIAEQRLIRRTTNQGTVDMKQWYMTIEPAENPAELAQQYSTKVLGVWL